MYYHISLITEDDGWIALDTNNDGSKSIRTLAQSISDEIGGEVIQPYDGDAQFLIKGDPYKLVFQYDDVFGSVVILHKTEDKEEVVALLERHFEKLKDL